MSHYYQQQSYQHITPCDILQWELLQPSSCSSEGEPLPLTALEDTNMNHWLLTDRFGDKPSYVPQLPMIPSSVPQMVPHIGSYHGFSSSSPLMTSETWPDYGSVEGATPLTSSTCMLQDWSGPPAYVSQPCIGPSATRHTASGFMASSSAMLGNSTLCRCPSDSGPFVTSTDLMGAISQRTEQCAQDAIPVAYIPEPSMVPGPIPQMAIHDSASQAYTASGFEPSMWTVEQGNQDTVQPRPHASPPIGYLQTVVPSASISNYSTLAMALLNPAPQYQAEVPESDQIAESSQLGNVDRFIPSNESVNRLKTIGHVASTAVPGTTDEASMSLLPEWSTETIEPPCPAIQGPSLFPITANSSSIPFPPSPTVQYPKDNSIVPPSAPSSHQRPIWQIEESMSVSASRKRRTTAARSFKKPRTRPQFIVQFNPPIIGTSERNTPAQLIFPDEQPVKAKPEGFKRREDASRVVLAEWEAIHREMKDGEKGSFKPGKYIKTWQCHQEVSANLLRCREANCTSTHRYHTTYTFRNHILGHYTKVPLESGETTESPRYIARLNVALEKGQARVEEYDSLMRRYKRLADMVEDAASG